MKSIGSKEYLILKLEQENRDFDIYSTQEYENIFYEYLKTSNINYIRLNYKYVVRYFIFGDINSAIDLIISPIIRWRSYEFKSIDLYNLTDNIANKYQNQDWKDFQSNLKQSHNISSKINLKSILFYFKIIFRAQFLILGFSFSGPDGSGKTTSLNKVKSALNQMRIKFKINRQVYKVFPRPADLFRRTYNSEEENKSPDKDKVKNFTYSLLVALYYLLDYLIGFIYLLFRRDKYSLVIFDRYIFDFFVHPNRNGLHSKVGILFRMFTPLYTIGIQNILCFTPAKIIYERKKELELNRIEYLNKSYSEIKQINQIWLTY